MLPSLTYPVLLPQHGKQLFLPNWICSALMISLQNLLISKRAAARDINGCGFNLLISTKET